MPSQYISASEKNAMNNWKMKSKKWQEIISHFKKQTNKIKIRY